MNIYERIKLRRTELNMTQEELAKKVGYKSRSAINKIEKGLRDINQSQIIRFAKALNTTTSYLLDGSSESNINYASDLNHQKCYTTPFHSTDGCDGSELNYTLTDNEIKLISVFSKLEDEKQDKVLQYAKAQLTAQNGEYIIARSAAFGGSSSSVIIDKKDMSETISKINEQLKKQNENK